MDDPDHHCHAKRCNKTVHPSMLMCPQHWRMVPIDLRAAVWEYYVIGQEVRKDPSEAYLTAASRAIDAVATQEGIL